MNAVRTHTAGATDPASAPGATVPPQPGPVTGPSRDARNLQWLLRDFVEEVPGVRSVAVVSSDGLLLLSSQTAGGGDAKPGRGPDAAPGPVPATTTAAGTAPDAPRMDLAAVVSGLASLTMGAARLMDGGKVRQTTVAMDDGTLFVMAISDGSLLGVHATAGCDMSVVAYHMALFVGRAGHVLTPGLRSELRQAMEGAG